MLLADKYINWLADIVGILKGTLKKKDMYCDVYLPALRGITIQAK